MCIRDSNGRVYLEGNSFAEVYSEADPRFLSYFGTVLQDTGDTETDQDTIVGGHTGLFAKIEMPYYTEGKLRGPDTSCDLLAPDPEATGDVDLIIYFPEDTLKRKWYYSRGTAYGTPLIKDGKQAYNYKTILSSLVFSATEGEDNRRLYLRRVLTFFGFSQTLVVDDDEGEASEEVICRDLEMLGVPYVLHKVNPGEDYPYPVDTLLNYDVVIWTNGKANTSTLLTSSDRSILYDYIMKYGGFVMLTGPYTPEFLAKEDPTFLNSVLASDFVDIVGSITFLGEKGSYAEGMKLSLVSGSSSTLLLPIPRNGGDSLFYHADYESYKAVTFVEDRLGKTTLMGFDYADIDNTKSTSTGTIDTVLTFIFGYDNESPIVNPALSTNLSAHVSEDGITLVISLENYSNIKEISILKENEVIYTTLPSHIIEYTDTNVAPNSRYSYIILAKDYSNKTYSIARKEIFYAPYTYPKTVLMPTVIQSTLPLVLHISENTSTTTVSIYDVSGRKVLTALNRALTKGTHLFSIDLQSLPSGNYYLSIQNAKGRVCKKFVVIH